jgi:hypothetical protein
MADPIQAPGTATVAVPDLKAGIKTTEFWLTILASASALIAQYQGALPEPWGTIAVAVVGTIYTCARAYVKSKATAQPSA